MTKISNQYSLTNVLFADAVNGRVGIGTASPTVALDVVGAGKFSGALTGTSAVFNGTVSIGNDFGTALTIGRFSPSIPIAYVRASTSSTGGFRLTNHNGADVIVVNGSNNLTLDSPVTNITGNVGIGTSSPNGAVATTSGLLHINSSNTNAELHLTNTTSGSTSADGFSIIQYFDQTILFNYEPNAMLFGTTGTERMRITSGGTLAIGTTTRANVWGLLTLRNTLNAVGSMWGIGPDTNNSLTVFNPSNVGVYIADGATSWTANSDINLKDIQGYIENAIDSIMGLKAIKFNWKSDVNKNTNIGLIAQEVKEVYPELIDKNSEGYLGVRYTELIPVLTKAIQELSAQSSEQQLQINELKALLNA